MAGGPLGGAARDGARRSDGFARVVPLPVRPPEAVDQRPSGSAARAAAAQDGACNDVKEKAASRDFEEQLPEDVQLLGATWRGTVACSLVGAGYIFLGVLLLGLGETGRLGWGADSIVAMRVVSWCFLFLVPFSLYSGNVAAYMVYGVAARQGLAGQLLGTTMTPWCMNRYAVAALWSPFRARMSGIIPLLFHGLPCAVTVLLLTASPREGQHLGVVPVTAVGGKLVRVMAVVFAMKLFPAGDRVRAHSARCLQAMVFVVVGFFASCACIGLASRFAGSFFVTLMVPVLMAYEFTAIHLIERSFIKGYVSNTPARHSLAGTPQGVIPSMQIALAHSNAEAARAAIALCSAIHFGSVKPVAISIGLGFVCNVLARTKWAFGLPRLLCKSLWDKNVTTVWTQDKFMMGYPCFFALASLGLARLALGFAPSPAGEATWVAVLLLAEELLEDLVVCLARRLGLCYSLPALPTERIEALVAERCGRRAAGGGATAGVADQAGGRAAAAPEPATVEMGHVASAASATAEAEVRLAYRFKYQIQEHFAAMPPWAHCLPTFLAQINFVLCLAIFGKGMPYLIGAPSTGAIEGIVFWPLPQQDGSGGGA